MPNVAVSSGALIIATAAVAAAIAVYNSQEAREFAEDVRRRIALALHSLGDEINPAARQPRFNRPEDAEGFMQSVGSAEPGVEADEESRRRQREELMYWNAVHMEKMAKEHKLAGDSRPENRSRGSSFDDFLQEDPEGEKGTYVYNTGSDVVSAPEEGLRNRGVRGIASGSVYANPFSDEHNIDWDEQRAIDASLMSPEASEKLDVMSDDIYTASPKPRSRETTATVVEQLIDTSEDPPVALPSMEMLQETPSFGHDNSVYASIHAWADNATASGFYSPLPATPRASTPTPQQEVTPPSPVFSDPPISVIGDGDMTPTDSISIAGSGSEVWAPRSGATSDADVMSVDGEGISTPGSWTEVGSLASENDVGVHH